MPIPRGITRDDVILALRELDSGIDHPFGRSTGYDLAQDGRAYPPKAVVGLAARRVLGRLLQPVEFSGGQGDGNANQVLRHLGFTVVARGAQDPKGVTSTAAPATTIKLGRAEIVARIAAATNVKVPTVGGGSTVASEFLNRIIEARGGDTTTLPNAYAKLAWLLASVGETYVAARDSSELTKTKGGSTVTNAGFRKLLRGLTQTPYCFILSIADHPISAKYGDIQGEVYGFDLRVSGRRPLIESPSGSRVIFYRTNKASTTPRMRFVADAFTEGVAEDHEGTYRVALGGYREFTTPVSPDDFPIAGWNRQHGIAEVDFGTLAELVRIGTGEAIVGPIPDVYESEPGAGAHAEPDFAAPFAEEDEPLAVPDAIEIGGGVSEPSVPTLLAADADPNDDLHSGRKQSARSRWLDRYAEKRAVHVTKRMLGNDGWRLLNDRQLEGVGYDLEFVREGRKLHVEVKGIRGPHLRFNLTAKEWARVREDPDFVVVAVRNISTVGEPVAELVTRDRLASAPKRWLQLRIVVPEQD